MEKAIICASCENTISENFCSVCGEKRLLKHDFALKEYIEESIEGISHFDNKFFRTSKLLFIRPGLLTHYFSTGRRVKYLKPFQLFLICNLLFFLLAGKLNIFSQSISNFYQYKPYTYFNTKEAVDSKADNANDANMLAQAFNERVGTQSKVYIAIFIPIFGLCFALLFRNTKRYFSEHLVFATHYFSFILLYYTLFTILVLKPFYWITGINFSSTFDLVSSFGSLILLSWYFIAAAKRFYHNTGGFVIIKALFTIILFMISLYAYRLLLFFWIINGIH
ncbi:MAG: DUF3667 domain-containing protein [Bacteroidota bacterium]